MTHSFLRSSLCLAAALAMVPAWTARLRAAELFQYNILEITHGAPGDKPVIRLSVTNPSNNNAPYDLKNDPAWKTALSPAPSARLFLQIGWDTNDFNNTDSLSNTVGGKGAAMPIPVNVLRDAKDNGDGTYTATSTIIIPQSATGTGAVAMEGHPLNGTVSVPVKSVVKYFTITNSDTPTRRKVVEIGKCQVCHVSNGTGVAPRLTLHGTNRTEEPQVCVICHNPNNTDIPYRLATDPKVVVGPYTYPEQSIDFKRLVHGIHASSAGFRKNPLVVIGFNHTVFDASKLTPFPGNLRNCVACHIDDGKKGTFELPLGSNVLASTFDSKSIQPDGTITIDTDPANDINITPTASVCSSCHDDRETISHMVSTGGASFKTLQGAIAPDQEKCVYCHGPGKDKSVRKVHLSDD